MFFKLKMEYIIFCVKMGKKVIAKNENGHF